MAKKRLSHRLKDHLLPHEGNGFRPLIFTVGGVAVVLVLVFLIQAAYLFQTRIVFKETDFLASVLPGVLATLANQDRAKAGVPTLEEDPLLAQAAQMKAQDMAAKGYFAHVDPEGRQPWYWFDKAGYAYSYAGENLAVNFTDSEDVQRAWMKSPTHHANIVKTQYTRIGIGVAQGEYKGKESTFVVQFFATPKAVAQAVPKEAPKATEEEPVALPASGTEQKSSQVLGVEIGTVMPEEAGEEPMLETEYQAMQEAEQGTVAGAAEPALGFFAQVAASPTHTLIYVLSALAAAIAILLLAAILMHARVQYLEVIGGGLLILLVIVSLLVANATSGTDVTVPEEAPGSATEAL